MRISLITIPLMLFVCGCAHYEYDILAPQDLTRHIATKTDTIVTVDPMEYRLRTVDNRLVVCIFNTTDETIQLLGDKSSVVDPEGQSHPIRSGPIAPHSFLKLILPPPRPRVYDPGPTFGFGVGLGVSRYYYPDPYYGYRHMYDSYYDGFYRSYYDQPRYMYIYDDNDPRFWEWSGTGEARLTLVYQQTGKDKPIRHEFTFGRRKM